MSNSTTIVITTSGQQFTIPGAQWTAEQLVNSYASVVPGLAQMGSEVTTDGEGNKTFTFRPRNGTKG